MGGSGSTTRDEVAAALAAVLFDRPRAVDNPTQLRSLLNDRLGERARALRAASDQLVAGADEQVPQRLVEGADVDGEAVTLATQRGFDRDTARWVCTTWAVAIGVAAPATPSASYGSPTAPTATRQNSALLGAPAPTGGNRTDVEARPAGRGSTTRQLLSTGLVAGSAVAALIATTLLNVAHEAGYDSGSASLTVLNLNSLRAHELDLVRAGLVAMVLAGVCTVAAAISSGLKTKRVLAWATTILALAGVVVLTAVLITQRHDAIHPWALDDGFFVVWAASIVAFVGALVGLPKSSR